MSHSQPRQASYQQRSTYSTFHTSYHFIRFISITKEEVNSYRQVEIPYFSIGFPYFHYLCVNKRISLYMKYFEVTFTAQPCNEIVTDVLSALAGEIGFESFVECEGGVQAYVQQSLFDENALKETLANFLYPIPKLLIPLPNRKTKTGTRNGKRIFFSLS